MRARSPIVKKFNALSLVGRFALAVALGVSVASISSAAPLCRAIFDGGPFSRFGSPSVEARSLGERFQVLVWNVYKGGKRGLGRDFGNLARNADLVLFQEAVDGPEFTRLIARAQDKMKWTLARSFLQSERSYTGVATGSTVEPLNEVKLLSPVTEPFTGTPKSALVSDFRIKGHDGSERVLRVINVHAINFVGLSSFTAHMTQVYAAIRDHRGPVVLAGDFNTWSAGRMELLKHVASLFDLKLVKSAPGLILTLDHVFVRGLEVVEAHDLAEIKSSDHQPLLLDFALAEGP